VSPARLRALLPEVWALVRPRRRVLALAFVLMAVSRVAGLVLPVSTRFFIDDVIGRGRVEWLVPLVLGVLGATAVQGLSAYALVQLVSKAAQKLIGEMRIKVQEHVGRLPVAFHDGTRSGDLVSRIMNDVEGFRNLIGTGLVELSGGLVTASLAFAVMLRLSPPVTLLTLVAIVAFSLVVYRAVKLLGPVFRERGQIYAEVTGRLTESLAGVRVVKAYEAEKREAAVFAAGVGRILDNVFRTLSGTSLLSLASTLLLGVVGAITLHDRLGLICTVVVISRRTLRRLSCVFIRARAVPSNCRIPVLCAERGQYGTA
jgi:subfamily B ATP-binding cassette protein MsbA